MGKETYVCWMDDDGVEDPSMLPLDSSHCVLAYDEDHAASDYAEQVYRDSAAEVGEEFEVNVMHHDSKQVWRFAVEVEYDPSFHVREIRTPCKGCGSVQEPLCGLCGPPAAAE